MVVFQNGHAYESIQKQSRKVQAHVLIILTDVITGTVECSTQVSRLAHTCGQHCHNTYQSHALLGLV